MKRVLLTLLGGVLCVSLSLTAFAKDDPYGDIGDIKLKDAEDNKHMPVVLPPDDAVVLFDGKNLDQWTFKSGKPATWKILEGGILQAKGGGDIVTKRKFPGRYKLHVEFRVPKTNGPDKGNSGVYLDGRYEIQILNTYGQTLKTNSCGAAPSVSAAKAPTVWQTFDIDYTPPACTEGVKRLPGVVTVYLNNIKIVDNAKITKDDTGGGLKGNPCEAGPIMLQDYGDPVQFRNIWLVAIK